MGQHLFLTSTLQLEEVLLPCLPAADLLRLGVSCKAMLSWVMSMPPSYWQVCLATLEAENLVQPAAYWTLGLLAVWS